MYSRCVKYGVTVLIVFFIVCYFWGTTSRSNSASIVEFVVNIVDGEDVIWPEHWKLMLVNASKLNLVLLDANVLKCIYKKGLEKIRACNRLFTDPVLRFGTLETDVIRFELLMSEFLTDNHLKLVANLTDNNGLVDTIKIDYEHEFDFHKFVFITFLQENGKNYHLLRGHDIVADIAVRRFETKTININNLNMQVLVPENVDLYLKYYDNGRFVQCNRQLAESVNATRAQKRYIPLEILDTLTFFIDDLLIKTGQTPFLAFGTLLGWYRECDIIPHTKDLDLFIFADEYPENFEVSFKSKHYSPFRRIGKKEAGLEVAFWLKPNIANFRNPSIDLFYVYDHNKTTQWTTLMQSVPKLSRTRLLFPKINQLCAGELYGHLYFVPCNFLENIEWCFGHRWNESFNAEWDESGVRFVDDGYWRANRSHVYVEFKTGS